MSPEERAAGHRRPAETDEQAAHRDPASAESSRAAEPHLAPESAAPRDDEVIEFHPPKIRRPALLAPLLATVWRLNRRILGLAGALLAFLLPFLMFATVLGVLAGLFLFVHDPDYGGDFETAGVDRLVFAAAGDRGPEQAAQVIRDGADGVIVDARLNPNGRMVVHGSRRLGTLDRFIKAMPEGGVLVVQPDTPGLLGDEAEPETIDVIEENDAFDRVYVSSARPTDIGRIEWLGDRVVTAFRFSDEETADEVLWPLRQEWFRRGVRKVMGADLAHAAANVDKQTKVHLIEQDLPLLVSTGRRAGPIGDALRLGPYGVVTADPQRAVAQRRD